MFHEVARLRFSEAENPSLALIGSAALPASMLTVAAADGGDRVSCGLRQAVEVGHVRGVRSQAVSTVAEPANRIVDPVLLAARDENGRALLDEPARGLEAEGGGAPGDHGLLLKETSSGHFASPID